MKKLFIILYLLTNIFVLGACGDVESEGDPQPRVPRVEVESDDYYVQITQEIWMGLLLSTVGWIQKQHRSML